MQYLMKISALFSVDSVYPYIPQYILSICQYILSILSVHSQYIIRSLSVYPSAHSNYIPQYILTTALSTLSVYPSVYLQYTPQYISVYPSVYLSIPLSISQYTPQYKSLSTVHSWYPQCTPTCTNLMASATELLV